MVRGWCVRVIIALGLFLPLRVKCEDNTDCQIVLCGTGEPVISDYRF